MLINSDNSHGATVQSHSNNFTSSPGGQRVPGVQGPDEESAGNVRIPGLVASIQEVPQQGHHPRGRALPRAVFNHDDHVRLQSS